MGKSKKGGGGAGGMGGLFKAIAAGQGKSSTLKPGESMNPGAGKAVVRYASVSDGGTVKSSGGGGAKSQVPIYGKVSGSGAAAGQPGYAADDASLAGGRIDPNKLPAPNDGSLGNIVANINHQAKAADAEAAYWKKKQTDDAAAYSQQVAAAQAQADQNTAALQNMMIQQQQVAQQQLSLQQQQIAQANAAAQEQLRQTEALAKAYIPTLQPTADAPVSGDTRVATNRNTKDSTLSSLSIISDNSLLSPSLVGLQIA